MRQFRVLVNGNEYKVAIEELEKEEITTAGKGAIPQKTTAPSPPKPAEAKAAAKPAPSPKQAVADGSGNIVAAMPGTILDIKVEVGASVSKGQPLLVLEAMKMENDVMAPCDGTVKEIQVAKGASVNSGDLLIVLG